MLFAADFHAPHGLSNPHVQTLLPQLMPRASLRYETELVNLPDGDFVELSWALPAPEHPRAPICLLFHGLESSAQCPRVRTLLATASRMGWRAVVMHFRGCGKVPHRGSRTYHAGATADAYWVISQLASRYPNALKVAIGISLGGNMLLKLAGEQGGDGLDLAGAIAISPPLDLAASADALNIGFSRVYQRRMLTSLKRKLARFESSHDNSDPEPTGNKRRRLDTFWAWDNEITAPMNGFESATDYYQRASAGRWLDRIELPTLILHAEDDPFMPRQLFTRLPDPSACVRVEIAEHGGHVGFVERRGGLLRSWLAHRVGEQLRSWSRVPALSALDYRVPRT
ncbi:hydrolase [Kushneria phosphatilytica]|uniref:Hydrolase n=1 Tax=Kushneria phosphatilytica TaxID=657387 RepID=A0A1S1NYK2_9GAMM|nr:hydrolase [Kushneria phosphatilytica]OHV11933.1 alpha/beta hydrolase [Kushneria phosphatilytica]QEL11115.1 hydrolase [Kushneria phosphatilytica]